MINGSKLLIFFADPGISESKIFFWQAPWDPGTLGPWDPGTLGPWDPGTLGPWDTGTPGPWDPGTLGPWDPGSPASGATLSFFFLGDD